MIAILDTRRVNVQKMAEAAIQWRSPGDVIMVSNCLNDYPDFGCWRRMIFRSDFEYQFYDIIDGLDAVKEHRLDRRLVIEIDRSGSVHDAGASIRIVYLLVPLVFYRRSDKRWIMQRGTPELRSIVYGIDITGEEIPAIWDHKANGVYKRLMEKMSEIMETENIRMDSPKDIIRCHVETMSVLDELLPTDIARTILDKAYGTTTT